MMLPAIILATALSAAPASLEVERFELRSNPWVNLHQALLYDLNFEMEPIGDLTAAEQQAWSDAVDGYRSRFEGRSPIFAPPLLELNRALSDHHGEAPPEGIDPAAARALARAMPVYRKHRWDQDDRANRFWMAVARPMLESAAEELIREHERAYGTAFPKRVRVEVSPRAWRFGAYSVGDADLALAVVSSTDPGNQGFAALEVLFHEAAHAIVGTTSGAIGGDLTKAAKELGVKPRHNLWHALQFFTAGELTRRAFHLRGVVYQPYILGMYERGFRGFREPLETHWVAYLDGKIAREEAIRRILRETAE